MADGSTLDLLEVSRSMGGADGINEQDRFLLRQWRIWHTSELAANRLLLQDGCEEEFNRLDDIGSAAFQSIDTAGGSSPIAIAARLHMHLHHADGGDFIQDLPHSLVVSVLRDLLPGLPEEMSAALQPIIAAADPAGAVRIKDALGTPNSLALNDMLEGGTRPREQRGCDGSAGASIAALPRGLTAVEAAAVRWSVLCKAMDHSEDKNNGAGDAQADAARDFVLMNEAATVSEAAIQAHFVYCELDSLDQSTPPHPDAYALVMKRLAIAAESVAKFLGDLAGDRYDAMTANRWGLERIYYRFPGHICVKAL